MEEKFQTKNSPYSVMNYNQLLMNLIHSIYFTMGIGGTGIEEAQNLKSTLKPKYQKSLKEFFDELDNSYNKRILEIENKIKTETMESNRWILKKKIKKIQKEYARSIVENVIRVLDENGALEFTQQILMGGTGFQKVMGLSEDS